MKFKYETPPKGSGSGAKIFDTVNTYLQALGNRSWHIERSCLDKSEVHYTKKQKKCSCIIAYTKLRAITQVFVCLM